jgi:hypothetical protein
MNAPAHIPKDAEAIHDLASRYFIASIAVLFWQQRTQRATSGSGCDHNRILALNGPVLPLSLAKVGLTVFDVTSVQYLCVVAAYRCDEMLERWRSFFLDSYTLSLPIIEITRAQPFSTAPWVTAEHGHRLKIGAPSA